MHTMTHAYLEQAAAQGSAAASIRSCFRTSNAYSAPEFDSRAVQAIRSHSPLSDFFVPSFFTGGSSPSGMSFFQAAAALPRSAAGAPAS